MNLPSKEEVLQRLKPLGIEAANLANDPGMLRKAIDKTYKLIPIPWRWFVGRKRIERLLRSAASSGLKAAQRAGTVNR